MDQQEAQPRAHAIAAFRVRPPPHAGSQCGCQRRGYNLRHSHLRSQQRDRYPDHRGPRRPPSVPDRQPRGQAQRHR
eukprot:3728087-Lingulodinium_polyedra.AAC.1